MDRFIILSVPRSGSTVLTRTLDSHPEIFCAGELFNVSDNIYHPEFHFPSWGFNSKRHFIQAINRLIDYPNQRFRAIPHIKNFYSKNNKHEEARGFKLMYSNINNAAYLWDFIKSAQIKIIVLTRNNVFKTILSRQRKAINRIAHVKETTSSFLPFSLRSSTLIQEMEELRSVNENLNILAKEANSMHVFYEDFENWDEIMCKIQRFIGVDVISLEAVLKKVGAPRWQDEIINFEAIEKLLREANYGHFI